MYCVTILRSVFCSSRTPACSSSPSHRASLGNAGPLSRGTSQSRACGQCSRCSKLLLPGTSEAYRGRNPQGHRRSRLQGQGQERSEQQTIRQLVRAAVGKSERRNDRRHHPRTEVQGMGRGGRAGNQKHTPTRGGADKPVPLLGAPPQQGGLPGQPILDATLIAQREQRKTLPHTSEPVPGCHHKPEEPLPRACQGPEGLADGGTRTVKRVDARKQGSNPNAGDLRGLLPVPRERPAAEFRMARHNDTWSTGSSARGSYQEVRQDPKAVQMCTWHRRCRRLVAWHCQIIRPLRVTHP